MRLKWTTIAIAFCLSAALTTLCWWAAGVGLGLFFGSTVVVATLVGPLSLADENRWSRALAGAAVVDGAGIVLLGAVVFSTITFVQWLWCYAVLCAFGLALAGAGAAAGRVMRSNVAGAVMAIVLGYAWLAWPIALAGQIRNEPAKQVARAVLVVHPWMAMNRPLLDWGAWSTGRLAYHHARLHEWGEMIPRTIMPCVFWHAGIGIGLLWMASRRPKRVN